KGRIFHSSLQDRLLPRRRRRRALIGQLQRLEDQPGVRAAPGQPPPLRSALQVERDQPHRRQRLQGPRRRLIHPPPPRAGGPAAVAPATPRPPRRYEPSPAPRSNDRSAASPRPPVAAATPPRPRS